MLRSGEPIALPCKYKIDYDDVSGIDCDQTPADMAVFLVPFKCEVVEAQCIVTETCVGATTTPVVAFDKRPTAGSDTNRGAADIGSLALSTSTAGTVIYDKAGVGVTLTPGMEVVCELTTSATGATAAGHFHPVLLVKYLPEIKTNLTNMTETA